LPSTIEYRETGETKISWLKSFSRSSSRKIMPIAVDCQSDCAKTPVSVYTRKS
jgi:hypothetical protein